MLAENEHLAQMKLAARAISPPSDGEQFAIQAHNLRKVYPASKGTAAQEALKSVDLNVPQGSIFGLLGPNGAGKSTFINILAGLVVKTSGQVMLWGFDLDINPRQVRASVGIVPQELQIDAFFTPAEVLEMQAGLYGVPRRLRRTQEILRAMHLEDKADAYARTLSGGMRRRLMVGKAMVHAPPVLVLDEPTAGVDVELRRELWNYMRDLNERGVTIVLTTHYLEEAQALCDRIAIIHQGSVAADGTTSDLLKMVDFKSLRITPAQALSEVPDSLKPLRARMQITCTADGNLQVDYPTSAVKVSEILQAISLAGIDIEDVATRESVLEDVFLHLTHNAPK